ncbi:unnamed protein product [Brassica rapa subsp. trilocularis]
MFGDALLISHQQIIRNDNCVIYYNLPYITGFKNQM